MALIVAWALTAAVAAARERHIVPTVATASVLVLVVLIGATQTVTTFDDLPIGLGELGDHIGEVMKDEGPPNAGRVSLALERVPSSECVVAVRPQILLDVDRVPSADRDGHVLLDIYGSALLAARHVDRSSTVMPGAFAFRTVQSEIVRQSRDCDRIVLSRRTCVQGRKDISAETQAKLDAGTSLVAHAGCIQLRRRFARSSSSNRATAASGVPSVSGLSERYLVRDGVG
jgi:hypothetical protein